MRVRVRVRVREAWFILQVPVSTYFRFPSSRLVLIRLKKKLDLKVWCVDVNPLLLGRWQGNGVQRLFCLGARVTEET